MLNKLTRWLVKIECIATSTSLLLLLLLSLFQILMRNLFDTGYSEIEVINRYLLIIAGMMGAALATTQVRHIKIDALTTIMSDSLKHKLQVPILLFAATVCIALCYYSVIFCFDEWEYAPSNERWTLPFILIYPVGFGLMSMHFLLACFREDSHAGS